MRPTDGPHHGGGIVSIEFLATALLVVLTPGTGVLYVMAAGISRGFRPSVVASVGCTLGIVPHMLAAITGLAAVLSASPVAFEVLKYLGAGYLLYMAWNTWRDRAALSVPDDDEPRAASAVIVKGVLVNLLNPKLTIFFVAFLPQFVRADDPAYLLRLSELSGVFMALTFVVFVGYGRFAASIRTLVISRPRILVWLRRTFAVGFAGLGLNLLVTTN